MPCACDQCSIFLLELHALTRLSHPFLCTLVRHFYDAVRTHCSVAERNKMADKVTKNLDLHLGISQLQQFVSLLIFHVHDVKH